MSEPSASPSALARLKALPWAARVAIAGAVLVVIGVVLGVVDRPVGTGSERGPRAAAERPSQPAALSAALPEGLIGPGDWLVGSDVAPGTYRSAGPSTTGEYCMWSRRSDAGGELFDGSIIASDGAYDPGPMLVTIAASDVVFRTRGCEPFVPVD